MSGARRAESSALAAVYQRRLGEEVKNLREHRLRSGPDLAELLKVSASTYSRAERGQQVFKMSALQKILNHLDGLEPIPASKKEELYRLQRAAGQRSRYGKNYSYVQPATRRFAELEWGAGSITEIGDLFVSGLLQSPRYIQALMDHGADHDINERLTRFRERRQEILTRPDPPRMLFIQSEAALRTVVGGPETMREQLEHLLKLAELPTLTLRFLPFTAGRPTKSLIMLDFAGEAAPLLVSSPFGTAHEIENRTQARLARRSIKLAVNQAASAEETSATIRTILNSL